MDNFPPRPSRGSQTPSQDPLDAAKQNGLDVDTTQAKSEPVVSTNDSSLARSKISEKKNHAPFIVTIVAAVMVIGSVVFAYYYFFVR